MPEEMVKLRESLNKRGIPWEDRTDNYHRSFPFLDMTIYRTWFYYNDVRYSVISGYGTYGGSRGLLEVMVDSQEPIGSLTADKVIALMEKGI